MVGGTLLVVGSSLDDIWIGVPGVGIILIAGLVWIVSPAKPKPIQRSGNATRDAGNRPTHNPTDFVGWN